MISRLHADYGDACAYARALHNQRTIGLINGPLATCVRTSAPPPLENVSQISEAAGGDNGRLVPARGVW